MSQVKEFKKLLAEMKPFDTEWCSEIQAQITMLPHGYILSGYNQETDIITSHCFVPKEIT